MKKHIERLKEIKESMERFENIEVVTGDAEAVKYALDILEAIEVLKRRADGDKKFITTFKGVRIW